MRSWRRNTRLFVVGITLATVIAAAIIAGFESRHGGATPTVTPASRPTVSSPAK